jgi:hypothetical protein
MSANGLIAADMQAGHSVRMIQSDRSSFELISERDGAGT